MTPSLRIWLLLSSFVALIGVSASNAATADIKAIQQIFAKPPDDARIMMRWWWFGSAVEKDELERELRAMKAAGIGGVEIQAVYPLELDDPEQKIKNYPYLSEEFRERIRFVADLAADLGLRMDVTLGSGWPFGGPHTPVTEAASRLRIERINLELGQKSVALPAMENGESLLAVYIAKGERRQVSALGAVRLAEVEGGRVQLPKFESGPHVLVCFIASRTGQQVKRAAVGAEGYVLDHYSREAIEHHLRTVAEPLIQSFGGDRKPGSVFSDSLEVFSSDWTPNFLPEFQKRAGYDLREHWMALVADDDPDARSVRHDWGKVLTELVEENYLVPIREWAHRHQTRFRSQTYGEPPAILSSNDLVDLPEGEAGPRWREFSTARWAASAGHIYGRPVISTETWTWLHSPAFRATPLDVKAEADLHFLQGINQLVGHGWPYSSKHAGEAGWRFYAAAVFNDHNPWFSVMPQISSYLQRLSYLLRQGEPANDVAVYLPTDDAWANFRPGKASVDRQMTTMLGPMLIPQILDFGYNFDFVDDRALTHVSKQGKLPWKIVVLPGVERMPVETARLLQSFAKDGGSVIATKRLPTMAPGYTDKPESSAAVATLTKNFALVEKDELLSAALQKATSADFQMNAAAQGALGFIHRKLADADIYFVANTANRTITDQVTFRSQRSAVDSWNAESGTVRPVDGAKTAAGWSVKVTLAPYESRVLVFSNGSRTTPSRARTMVSSVDVSKGWSVSFAGKGASSHLDAPRSWTEDDATKFYSGEATYERTLDLAQGAQWATLDFGAGKPLEGSGKAATPGMQALLEPPVREAAVVFVNGKRAGEVWHPPYELDVSGFLRPGTNQLRIVVANTAINEIAGKALPSYRLLNMRYGERFVPQGFEAIAPLPSGILAPIHLRIEK